MLNKKNNHFLSKGFLPLVITFVYIFSFYTALKPLYINDDIRLYDRIRPYDIRYYSEYYGLWEPISLGATIYIVSITIACILIFISISKLLSEERKYIDEYKQYTSKNISGKRIFRRACVYISIIVFSICFHKLLNKFLTYFNEQPYYPSESETIKLVISSNIIFFFYLLFLWWAVPMFVYKKERIYLEKIKASCLRYREDIKATSKNDVCIEDSDNNISNLAMNTLKNNNEHTYKFETDKERIRREEEYFEECQRHEEEERQRRDEEYFEECQRREEEEERQRRDDKYFEERQKLYEEERQKLEDQFKRYEEEERRWREEEEERQRREHFYNYNNDNNNDYCGDTSYLTMNNND